MDKKKQDIEELFLTLMDLYSSFQGVVKNGTEEEKIASTKLMRHFQKMLKEKVTDYEDSKGVSISAFDELLANFIKDENIDLSKYKSAMHAAGQEVKGEIEKIEKVHITKKKRPKNYMSKRLRSKD